VIGLIVFLARFVTVLFAVRLTLRVVASFFRTSAVPAGRPASGRQIAAVDLVRDRICNTALPRGRAVVAVVAGHEEHFCSRACAQRALAESSGGA
jgi:hypothetical protein